MPSFTPIAIVALLIIVLAVVSVYAFKMKKKHNRKPDYYNFFIMGVIWVGAGIPLKMYPLVAMGLAFMLAGIVHKKEWKKNHLDWTDLSKEEKNMRWIFVGFLLFALLAGVFAFYLTAGGLGEK